jgi:hypothetical protein
MNTAFTHGLHTRSTDAKERAFDAAIYEHRRHVRPEHKKHRHKRERALDTIYAQNSRWVQEIYKVDELILNYDSYCSRSLPTSTLNSYFNQQ